MKLENITIVQLIGQTEGINWKFTMPYISKGNKFNKFRVTCLNVAQAIWTMPVASGTFPVSVWLMNNATGHNMLDVHGTSGNRYVEGQRDSIVLGLTPRQDDWNFSAYTTQKGEMTWIWDSIPTSELFISFQLMLTNGYISKWTVNQQMSALFKIEELSLCECTVWDLAYQPQVIASYQQSCIENGQGTDVLTFKIRSGIMKTKPYSRWLISIVSACIIGSQEPAGNNGGQYIQSISGWGNGRIKLDNDAIASGLYESYANTISNDIAIGVYGRNDQHAFWSEVWNGEGASQFISNEIPTQEFQFRAFLFYKDNLIPIQLNKNSSLIVQLQEIID